MAGRRSPKKMIATDTESSSENSMLHINDRTPVEIQVHLAREELEVFVNSKVQITLIGDIQPSMWGQLVSIQGDPGKEVLHLSDVQKDEDVYDEYRVPVSSVKQLEDVKQAVQLQHYVNSDMLSKSLQLVYADREQTPRTRTSSRLSQSLLESRSRHASPTRSTRSRPSSPPKPQSRSRPSSPQRSHSKSRASSQTRSMSRSRQPSTSSTQEGQHQDVVTTDTQAINCEAGSPELTFQLPNEQEPDDKSVVHKAREDWLTQVVWKLKKERQHALEHKQVPDYHLALLSAFHAAQIHVNVDEIRSIKIKPQADLGSRTVLKKFWDEAMRKPSTTLLSFFEDSFEDTMNGVVHKKAAKRSPPISSQEISPERKKPDRRPSKDDSSSNEEDKELLQRIFSSTRRDEIEEKDSSNSEQLKDEARKFLARHNLERNPKVQRHFGEWIKRTHVPFDTYLRLMQSDEEKISEEEENLDEDDEWNERGAFNIPKEDWTEKQWQSHLVRCLIPTPAPLRPSAEQTQSSIQLVIPSRTAMTDFIESIDELDFMCAGRYAHIFIPSYVYVPEDVLKNEAAFRLPEQSAEYYALWHKLYHSRREAAEEAEKRPPLLQKYNVPWINLLQDKKVAKPLFVEMLDQLQYTTAHAVLETKPVDHMSRQRIYDTFFRPLERLVAADLKLGEYLRTGMIYPDTALALVNSLIKLTGLSHLPKHVSASFIMTQMSRVRLWSSRDFCPLKATQPPIARLPLTMETSRGVSLLNSSSDSCQAEHSFPETASMDAYTSKQYESAKTHLHANLMTLHQIMKEIKELKDELKTNEDFVKKNSLKQSVGQLKDRMNAINSSNLQLWKTIQKLAEESVRQSEIKNNPTLKEKMASLKDLDIQVLLEMIDDWQEERKQDRDRLKTIRCTLATDRVTRSYVPTMHEAQARLDLIQNQIALDKKIQETSIMLNEAITIAEFWSHTLDKQSKTQLNKSIELNEHDSVNSRSSHAPEHGRRIPNRQFLMKKLGLTKGDQSKRKHDFSPQQSIAKYFKCAKASKKNFDTRSNPEHVSTNIRSEEGEDTQSDDEEELLEVIAEKPKVRIQTPEPPQTEVWHCYNCRQTCTMDEPKCMRKNKKGFYCMHSMNRPDLFVKVKSSVASSRTQSPSPAMTLNSAAAFAKELKDKFTAKAEEDLLVHQEKSKRTYLNRSPRVYDFSACRNQDEQKGQQMPKLQSRPSSRPMSPSASSDAGSAAETAARHYARFHPITGEKVKWHPLLPRSEPASKWSISPKDCITKKYKDWIRDSPSDQESESQDPPPATKAAAPWRFNMSPSRVTGREPTNQKELSEWVDEKWIELKNPNYFRGRCAPARQTPPPGFEPHQSGATSLQQGGATSGMMTPPRSAQGQPPAPLPLKKRPQRARSPYPSTPAARRLFQDLPTPKKYEEKESWNQLPDEKSAPRFGLVLWKGRNKNSAPDWAQYNYNAEEVAQPATTDDIARMVSSNSYKVFPIRGLNQTSSISFLAKKTALGKPWRIVIDEFHDEMAEYYQIDMTYIMFKSLTKELTEISQIHFEPQVKSVDLLCNTEKNLSSRSIHHYAPDGDSVLLIEVNDAASTNGVERQVTVRVSTDKDKKEICFPWLHLSRFIFFAKALIEQLEAEKQKSN